MQTFNAKQHLNRTKQQDINIAIRFRAEATKFSPSPPKISFTPPKVFSAPASKAQSAPPAIPARMLMLMITEGSTPLCCSPRSIQVVKIAPRVICPSMPMFHRPAVKVMRSPAVARSRGTHETSTFAATSHEPTAPRTMFA